MRSRDDAGLALLDGARRDWLRGPRSPDRGAVRDILSQVTYRLIAAAERQMASLSQKLLTVGRALVPGVSDPTTDAGCVSRYRIMRGQPRPLHGGLRWGARDRYPTIW